MIPTVEQLRSLNTEQLKEVANDVRATIISTLSSHPGHLASSLGTVELTVALHYVFNTPDDKLVWDVGHQAYAHKLLTGRADRFASLRTYGGLSGFPKRDESPFDAFGTGHSSTSISAALGMATASALQGNLKRQHIAVIGDGSMTGGQAFEALNNAGVSKANILVILNDNGISIDKAVGGLSHYLTRITASPRYNRLKEQVWQNLNRKPGQRPHRKTISLLQHATFFAKTALLGGSNLFESLGFRYFGPIDGHNIDQLTEMLQRLKAINGPKLLHVVTTKGKGLPPAEHDPITYHAPGKYEANTGRRLANAGTDCPPRYQDVFGETLTELASDNPNIVAITPAMLTGSSLNLMKDRFPARVFDVGIAEQHAVTFAAGLATQGMIPFCCIYSSFAQRAYDQIIHDVALQRLPVVLCFDRAGLVGEDGATHHGAFDISALRPIPNLTIASPIDEQELRNMMLTATHHTDGPFAIRYPRGTAVHTQWHTTMHDLPVGKGVCIKEGTDVAVLTIGHVGNDALTAASEAEKQGVNVAVYNMRFVKPIDKQLLDNIAAAGFRHIITVEDGSLIGGFGSAVVEHFAQTSPQTLSYTTCLGIPDCFVSHGTVRQLKTDCGYSETDILKKILEK
ncbi:MAG: 1-deoxy-D-xylulose-5-phosphate synthase [Bacteroidales bacterium]|nr:1-deoxy-D-xylulose-5-phosphate synthase [Bacteroidales bacterium]